MEPLQENGAVNLRRTVVKQPATRIIGKTPNLHTREGFSAISSSRVNTTQKTPYLETVRNSGAVNLTNNNFSVTRVHAHAYAHARANNSIRVGNDAGGLKRVLEAALSGGDVKVASIKPMSFSARFIAFLLLPAMLVMPIVPAYANEAPLAERIAGDVAEIIGTNEAPIASEVSNEVVGDNSSVAAVDENSTSNSSTETPVPTETPNSESTSPSQDTPAPTPEVAGVATDVSNQEGGGSIAPNQSNENVDPAPSPKVVEVTPPTPEGGGTEVTTSSSSEIKLENINPVISPPVSENKILEIIETPSATTSDADIAPPLENPEDVQVIDIPSVEVQEDLDAIRARLRRELRDEVKMEVKGEVEKEVYRGCKNLDGIGYYCIPDAKSFGSAVVANERAIVVNVQQDEIEGDKEIFLSRNNVALQLTHNSDDDVFPVLDPASDLLVWQSLKDGHWQIAYSHVNDVGVPKVNYLTAGENNFNPKVYRSRIVWQAWVEGNWEIISASKAYEKLGEDGLTAEHRAVGVDGNWNVKRITANNSPDMFPSVTGDAVTWQAIDDGVWQVFSYDLVSGESRRISKKGIKSESPRTALVWSEEDETGQLKLVGSDVNNTESLDFTELARRLVDQSKNSPKSPITNTEIVVVAPSIVRVEEEAPSIE